MRGVHRAAVGHDVDYIVHLHGRDGQGGKYNNESLLKLGDGDVEEQGRLIGPIYLRSFVQFLGYALQARQEI